MAISAPESSSAEWQSADEGGPSRNPKLATPAERLTNGCPAPDKTDRDALTSFPVAKKRGGRSATGPGGRVKMKPAVHRRKFSFRSRKAAIVSVPNPLASAQNGLFCCAIWPKAG